MGLQALRFLPALMLALLIGCASSPPGPIWTEADRKVCDASKLQLPPEARTPKRHWFQSEGIPPGVVEDVLRANYECGAHLRDELEKERREERCEMWCQTKVFFSGAGAGSIVTLLVAISL